MLVVKVLLIFVTLCGAVSGSIRLSTNTRPVLYDLKLKIDLDKFEFSGNVEIEVSVNETSDFIELHKKDLTLEDKSILLIDGNNNKIGLKFKEYQNENEILKLTFADKLIAGRTYFLSIDFEGKISDDTSGLYRSSYYDAGEIR